ncbi:MAG: diadenylate cyclase CdaA [Parachlamydiales bacterium]|jgi:uncharacterized protein (TIGR00159 family)
MGFISALFEIILISIILNYLLSFFWNTKSIDLVWGLLAFLMLVFASSLFDLPVLQKVMLILGDAAVIAVIVIFQPELRVALSKLALKGRKRKELSEFDRFLEPLSNCVYKLADKRIGALIALENEDSLEEWAQKAILLNADFSAELLETIFAPSTPLHDGAVILRGQMILAAAAILPLAEDSLQLAKSMGTRHRAALGLSHISDALVIVVSEESGKVSIARDGIMTRGIKTDRFKGIIRSLFNPTNKMPFQNKFNFKEWLKQ